MSVIAKQEVISVDRRSSEYLAQLLSDKKHLQIFPNVFIHVEKILDEEINKVRHSLFQASSHSNNSGSGCLPDPCGPVITMSEKLMVPVSEYPDYNFVGRILGPRGLTVKQLELDTGCKVMVRGKGSMRDRQKEDMNRNKPNWEHLNEELHVLITCEDTEGRAQVKLNRAKEEVKKLLVPTPDGEDDLKRRQLVELALMNGTYRDTSANSVQSAATTLTTSIVTPVPLSQSQHVLGMSSGVIAAHTVQAGTQLFLAPRLSAQFGSVTQMSATAVPQTFLGPGGTQYLQATDASAATGATNILYPFSPYLQSMLDYSTAGLERSAPGAFRRTVAYREHPYAR